MDTDLEIIIKNCLHKNLHLDSRDITVIVDHGDVTLSGTVPTQVDRDTALLLVEGIDGVVSLQSDLVVKTHSGLLPSDFGRD